MFWLTLAILIIPPVAVSAQSGLSNSLPPPKPDLLPVHFPDLSALEDDVRRHLLSAQASLTAAVKNPVATNAMLSDAYGVLGQTYHAYSLNSAAKECYVNASRLAPQDFRWVYLAAKLDHEQGRIDEAIKGYLTVRKLNPSYLAAAVNLGNIYLESNRLAEARLNFSAAFTLEKNSAAAHYGLGQVALSERNYSVAAKYFEETLKLVPAANRTYYSLAMAYRGLGELEKAKASLTLQGPVGVRSADPLIDALQELIKGERVHLIRGRIAIEAHRYDEAATEFRKALLAKPDSVTALVNLGAALTQQGDLQGAMKQFEAVLRVAPDNPNAHYNLGLLLANENRYQEASGHLQVVLKSNPNDSRARFLLAQMYLKSGRKEEALQEFSRVVEADPNNEHALLAFVRLLLNEKRYKQALDALEKGHAQFSHKGPTTVLLARVLATSPIYEQRNGTRALELANLVYRTTRSIEHGAIVSMALAELGLCAEAAEWQRKLIAAAEDQQKTDLLGKLKSDLSAYESSPCRPRSDPAEVVPF